MKTSARRKISERGQDTRVDERITTLIRWQRDRTEETPMAKVHTEADLEAYSDEVSFQKGYSYYLNHTIVEPILSALEV